MYILKEIDQHVDDGEILDKVSVDTAPICDHKGKIIVPLPATYIFESVDETGRQLSGLAKRVL